MPYLVNGERIDESEIRKEAGLLRPGFERAMTGLDRVEAERQLWEWSRENVIEKTLLRQEALRSGDEVSEEDVLRAVEALRAHHPAAAGKDAESEPETLKRDVEIQIRVERLLAKVAGNAAPPDPNPPVRNAEGGSVAFRVC